MADNSTVSARENLAFKPSLADVSCVRGENQGAGRVADRIRADAVSDPPDEMNDAGKDEWERITPILVKAGLWSEAYRTQLVLYCDTLGLLSDLKSQVVPGEFDSKLHAAIARYTIMVARLGEDYGFTPRRLSQIKLPNVEEKINELDKFLESA